MSRKVQLALAISVAMGLAPLSMALASSYTGTLTIDCSGFSDLAPNTVTFDRDNTGSGQEAYRYDATDGAGTQIFTFSSQLPLGSYTLGSASWSIPPAYNPLTVTLTSLAGNGYPEQVIFSLQGTCPRLPDYAARIPTLSTWGLAALAGLLAAVGVVAMRQRFA